MPARKYLRIHRAPSVLVLHIKRFKYTHRHQQRGEKITANVTFPLTGLHLNQYMSEEAEAGSGGASPIYDLFAICNHSGSLLSGHYTASCRIRGSGKGEEWVCFNDDKVTSVNAN